MRRLAVLLLALWAVAVPPAAAQQADEDDAGFLTRQLQNALSGEGREVRIEGFEGALSATARIARISFADRDGVWLVIEDATMNWNRAALLRGAVRINELTADRISVTRPPAPDPAAPPDAGAGGFALPDLPVSVEIGRIDARRVDLAEPVLGTAASLRVAGSLALLSGTATVDLTAERLDEPAGRFELGAEFDGAQDILALRLSAREAEGGLISTLAGIPGAPALELTVTSDGPLSDFQADLRLAAAGQQRLGGTVTVTRGDAGAAGDGDGTAPWRLRADLAGDIGPMVAPDIRPFFGDRTDLNLDAVRLPEGAIRIDTLTLRTRALYVDAVGSLAADGTPRDLLVRGLLRDLRGGPVRLPAGVADLSVASALLRAEFDAVDAAGWQAVLRLEGLRTEGLRLADLRLTGAGNLTPGDGPEGLERVTGDIALRASGIAPADPALGRAIGDAVTARAELDWTQDSPLELRDLAVEGADYRIALGGRLAEALSGGRFDGQLRATADDLTRFSGLAGRDLAGAAEARASGTVNLLGGAFDLELAARAGGLGTGDPAIDRLVGGQPRLTATVRRDAEGLTLEAFDLDAGVVAARGTMALTGPGRDLVADGAVSARIADLSVLSGLLGRPLAGAATAQVSGRGALDLSVFDIEAGIDATGVATGDPALDRLIGGDAAARLSAERTGAGIALRSFTLDAPGATVAASGTAIGLPGPATVAGQASARIADLAGLSVLVGRPLTGSVAAEISGTAAIDLTDPDPVAILTAEPFALNATVTAEDLSTGDPAFDPLLGGDGRIVVDAARADDILEIETFEAALPGLSASATGRISGPPDAATAEGQARLRMPDLAALDGLTGLALAGALDARARGTAALDGSRFDVTAAADATGLRTGIAAADRIAGGDGRLRADLTRQDGALTVRALDLTLPGLTATASGQLTGAGGNVDLRARLDDLGVLVPELPGAVEVGGTLGQRADGQVEIDATARGPGGIDADVAGSFDPGTNRADLRMTGAATLALADVAIDSREIALRGPVRFDLSLAGPPGLDSLSGNVTVPGGSVVLPALPLRLDGLNATVRIDGRAIGVEAGAAVAAGGRVAAQGSLRLDPAAGVPADLAVTLDNAVLRQRGLYDVSLSGQVSASGPLTGAAAIAGRIAVNRAEITVAPPPPGGGAIADMVHLNETGEERTTRRRAGLIGGNGTGTGGASGGGPAWPLDITIAAPKRIFVRGRGLDAELGGEIAIRGTTAAPVPSGAFELVRGRLNLLAKRLDLREARVSLLGDLVPEIYVLAQSQSANDVTAFIEIAGPATDPEITFRSDPELPQDEVLAELFFGRPVSELSALQVAQLAAAIAELAGRGGDGVMGRLRAATGFDDIDVETDEEGTITARAGRYVTDNVYSSIGVTDEGTTELQLNLDISPSVTARGTVTSDSESSIGVFFERDY